MKKENFKSRLGFILVSAGCAIGLGNVWRFPYMCGWNGGAVFILIYLFFLIFLGLPALICEFSVGRNTKQSIATSFELIEKPGQKWHLYKYFGIVGNYTLVFFYTAVASWMVYYAYKSAVGTFVGMAPDKVAGVFGALLSDPVTMTGWAVLSGVICFGICKIGLQAGVEKITTKMMLCLLAVMIVLAVHSVFLEGAEKGLEYYLIPNFAKVTEIGVGNVLYGAMSQAFFTLSIGIGSMHIFGCSIGKERRMVGEASWIVCLDTFVALMAGFIIIPACFAFGLEAGAGPGLIFITLPNVFAKMPGGVIWSTMFFVFMTFAAFSTLIAVYENLISFGMELFGWSRAKSTYMNCAIVLLGSLPCIFGFNIWSWMQPFGKGSGILDLEDFIVSNNLLPLGSLGYLLFCTHKNGWGWANFIKEANAGSGVKLPESLHWYMSTIVPAVIVFIYLKGYYDMFAAKGGTLFYVMMAIAFCFLGLTAYIATRKGREA